MAEIFNLKKDSMGMQAMTVKTDTVHRDKNDIGFNFQVVNIPHVSFISINEEEAKELAEAILNALNNK